MKKLRFGIIATGGIAHKFARTAPIVDEIDLVAVASRSQEKAQSFADKYGIEKAYGSYEDLFADPDIDAVYIATPHNFHMQNCIDAANAGKHILCEKPMALTREENEAIFAAAEKNGVFAMEAMWTRFLPGTIKARDWVSEGLIGEVRQIFTPFGNYRAFEAEDRLFSPNLAGGALYDLGVYTIEFILDFTKEKTLKDVKGFLVKNEVGTDNSASAIFQFDDGATAQMYCSFDCATSHETYVYGTKGYIKFDSFQVPKFVELYIDGELRDVHESAFESGFEYEIRHLVESVREGRLTSHIIPPEDTLACADIFEQIFAQNK